jgi:hypothetical protein
MLPHEYETIRALRKLDVPWVSLGAIFEVSQTSLSRRFRVYPDGVVGATPLKKYPAHVHEAVQIAVILLTGGAAVASDRPVRLPPPTEEFVKFLEESGVVCDKFEDNTYMRESDL